MHREGTAVVCVYFAAYLISRLPEVSTDGKTDNMETKKIMFVDGVAEVERQFNELVVNSKRYRNRHFVPLLIPKEAAKGKRLVDAVDPDQSHFGGHFVIDDYGSEEKGIASANV